MTPSQIVIGVPMAGSAISVIQRVLLTITLIQRLGWLSERLTLTEMFISQASPTSCPILQISFGLPQRQEKNALPTSYSRDELHRLAWAGVGASILEAIRIVLIAMSLSLSKVMRTALSLISRY
jgi:hypothetical protein